MTSDGKTTILAIDDERIILETIAGLLGEEEYHVLKALDGRQGLAIFKSRDDIDLVITDLMMPEMDGMEVVSAIQAANPEMPVLILSGAGQMQDSIDAFRRGAWDYLTKPVDIFLLKHSIARALERKRLLEENRTHRQNLESEVDRRTEELKTRSRQLEESNRQLEAEIRSRKEAHILLKRAADQWRTTFDSITDLISVHDLNHRILQVNKALANFFGKEPQELLGKYCFEVFHGQDIPWFQCPHRQTLKQGRTVTREIIDKTLGAPFLITISPIYDQNGVITGVVHIAKDISEQKKMEETVQQTRNLESLGNLAGGLAHDFNNLLAALVGYIDLARMDAETEDGKLIENLENAKVVTKVASGLTNQLITFSRGGAPYIKPVDLRAIVREALSITAPERNGISCQCEIPADLPMVLADEQQISTVLNNILFNAKESMPQGGTLSLEAALLSVTVTEQENNQLRPGPYIRLTIQDSGSGIAPEIRKRVFDPYFTTKGMDSRKGKGLGLAICYSIIKKHKGQIELSSETDKGTQVTLYLPVSSPAEQGLSLQKFANREAES